MPRRRIDKVRIALHRRIVVIPWSSRAALMGELRKKEPTNDVRDTFLAAGTTQHVRLTDSQKAALVVAIEHWGSEVPGGLTDGLPEGIFELRNALHDDLDDSRVDPDGGSDPGSPRSAA